jgi:hypothetical protein
VWPWPVFAFVHLRMGSCCVKVVSLKRILLKGCKLIKHCPAQGRREITNRRQRVLVRWLLGWRGRLMTFMSRPPMQELPSDHPYYYEGY